MCQKKIVEMLYPLLGLTSSSRPASVEMFDVKIVLFRRATVEDFIPVASFILSELFYYWNYSV